MMATGLQHTVALSTGVNNPRGIGAATAQAFAAEGPVVFATSLRRSAAVRTPTVPGAAFYRRAAETLPLRTITAAHHDRHVAVKSRAVALMMAEYARRYVARGARWGRIINVSTGGASEFSPLGFIA
jgi:NAD(P)-dependent dehydrogenase (short-subunit alcohol dehydrogenase family)